MWCESRHLSALDSRTVIHARIQYLRAGEIGVTEMSCLCLVLFRTGPGAPHHVVSDMSYDVILIMNFIMNFMIFVTPPKPELAVTCKLTR